jgi:hypothetical protein
LRVVSYVQQTTTSGTCSKFHLSFLCFKPIRISKRILSEASPWFTTL